MEKKTLVALILALSLLLFISSTLTSAFFTTDDYSTRGEIASGGSVNLTFGSPIQNISKLIIGQPLIGMATSSAADLKMCFGIFCTGIYQPVYSINFTGILNYSNGSAVRNSPITFTINYFDTQFEGMNFTDGSGKFFVKVDNLPEYIIKKDLNVTVKVQSEIEASYQCYYNYSLQKCCKKPLTVC